MVLDPETRSNHEREGRNFKEREKQRGMENMSFEIGTEVRNDNKVE